MKEFFADVLLPLPLSGTFTYKVPDELADKTEVGKRVIVQFGQKKFYTAIVLKTHYNKPDYTDIKSIESVLDENPVVFPENLKFWSWIAEYYCCSLGEVMKAALPSALKLESSTKIKIANHPDFESLSLEESNLIELFKDSSKPLKDFQKKGGEVPFRIIKSLLEKKVLEVEEKINLKYKAKTEAYILLNPEIKSEKILQQKLNELTRAKKQEQLLIDFCELTKVFTPEQVQKIGKKELLKKSGSGDSILKGLVKKKIFQIKYEEVTRLEENENGQVELNFLNQYQNEALNKIKEHFKQKNTVLLHGVTSSGKTEIYSHLIEEAINKGKQVLYLVPEISLTTQLVRRLKNIFGNKVGVYHSRLNDSQRVEIWNKVLDFESSEKTKFQVILGARSSVFLPFKKLGLIIVDEEHENSYKQFDPAPRYNARDLAVLMGIQHNTHVLLGTATPSFETYYNVQSGKFGLVELFHRHGEMELPEIIISDLQRAYKRKQMKSFLAPELYSKITESLEKKEQVILFQNRRGYAPFVECMECGWIPKCERCDVSLTYHKFKKQLTCHYCGYYMHLPDKCHDCGSTEIKTRGFGTEKIEDELKSLFPSARIARMDMDSTRSKNALDNIIKNLENQKTDILVGTQMVTKGLDFEHVNVVGILNADNLLNFPDFRAHERSFQLMAQVSGRAGRKHRKGTVVIQTSQPEHPVIKEVESLSFKKSYSRQLEERKMFRYPPFFRLIKIVVKHRNPDKLNLVSKLLANELRQNKQFIVLGPEFPLVSRISLWYHKEIWIKLNRDNQLGENKKIVVQATEKIKHQDGNSGTSFNIDIDPM